LTCTQSCAGFAVGVGVGVGVGVVVVVGVGLGLGDGLGLADELSSGVGLAAVGVGVGVGVAAALAEGVGDAEAAADAEGLAAAGDELSVMTAVVRAAVPCCPLRADVVTAAGRLAHTLVELVPAEFMRASRDTRATAGWEELVAKMVSPARMPKTVTPKATIRARRNTTDTISPPCRPARGYQASPP
jgi:hypothetical protein